MHSTKILETESIRYTGSKKNIIPKILDLMQEEFSFAKTVLDGFSGTTRVSQALKQNGYGVTSNDKAEYSRVLGECYLLNSKPPEYYKPMIYELNSRATSRPIKGWFTQHYGGEVTDHETGNATQLDNLKRPWQFHNTMILDSVLENIPSLTSDPIEQSVLLTSLMLALDSVDNTMGHQVSYLKNWSKRSYASMELKVPRLLETNNKSHVMQKDVFDIRGEYDVCYLDPPYGTNNQKHKTTRVRYHSYYHIWTTICKNDKPRLIGASKRRLDASSDVIPGALSVFESTNQEEVYKAMERLLMDVPSYHVILSYSNKSKLSKAELLEILKPYRILQFLEFSHKENAMKKATINGNWLGDQGENKEFLIAIQK